MYMLDPSMLWCWGQLMVGTDSIWNRCERTLPKLSSLSLYSQPIEPSSRMCSELISRLQPGETIRRQTHQSWPHRQWVVHGGHLSQSCIFLTFLRLLILCSSNICEGRKWCNTCRKSYCSSGMTCTKFYLRNGDGEGWNHHTRIND